MSAVQIVLLVVALVVVDLLFIWVLLRFLFRRGRRRVAEQFAGLALIHRSDANFFGVTSRRGTQLRGNGGLALTDSELRFVPWVGKNGLVVALTVVTRVDTCRSHLRKAVGRKLLRVAWRTEGGEDSAAWYVPELDGWVDRVTNAARRAGATLA